MSKYKKRNVCSVTNCRAYRDAQKWPEPLTFHEFPSDLARRKLWLKAIGREDWIPGDKAKICAMHFNPESYKDLNSSAIAQAQDGPNNNKPLKRLINTAVPTLYLDLEPLPRKSTEPIAAANLNGVPKGVCHQVRDPLQVAQTCQILQPGYFPDTLNCVQYNKCIVPNCQEYRDASRWQDPLILYDFPSDSERRTHWFEALQKNVIDGPLPPNGRICSVHFDQSDFQDTNKKILKPEALPVLNLTLPRLGGGVPDFEMFDEEHFHVSHKSSHAACDSRKITNIIVVDLMKESKKTRAPEKQVVVENDCVQCLQLLKEVRDLECQLFEAKTELREQKKLIDSLKSQLSSQNDVIVPS